MPAGWKAKNWEDCGERYLMITVVNKADSFQNASHVQITVNENWMRLDFDNDGSVTVDDLKKSMVGLYDFLKNFDIIETTTTIKSKIYTDAIAYMQAELQEDTKKKDITGQVDGKAKDLQAIEMINQQDIDGIN